MGASMGSRGPLNPGTFGARTDGGGVGSVTVSDVSVAAAEPSGVPPLGACPRNGGMSGWPRM